MLRVHFQETLFITLSKSLSGLSGLTLNTDWGRYKFPSVWDNFLLKTQKREGLVCNHPLEPFSNDVILASRALDAAPVGGKVNFS